MTICTSRPVNNGAATGVDAVCTYNSDSSSRPFDRVQVYHEMKNQTKDFTVLGPYQLDRNSLYVNGMLNPTEYL